jgi:hypothetical protein
MRQRESATCWIIEGSSQEKQLVNGDESLPSYTRSHQVSLPWPDMQNPVRASSLLPIRSLKQANGQRLLGSVLNHLSGNAHGRCRYAPIARGFSFP